MYMGLFVGFALALLFLAELLLVGVDAALQAAKLLCERVGEVDLIERVRRGGTDALTGDLDDARLDADDGGVGRDLLQNDGVRADAAVVADGERAEHLRTRRDQHVVADGRVALAGVLAGAAEGDAVVDGAVVADLGGLADDDAHAVVDEQALADLRTGVYLDAGHMPRKLRKRTREEKVLVLIEPVCLAVVKQSMEALIEEDDLERGARRRVAVADRASVVEQALEDHNTDIHSLEIERTSRFAENTM